MKKKHSKKGDEIVANDVDIKALVSQNSAFFDKLVNLVPAKFYLPVDDKEKLWHPGLSKSEKALVMKESRENTKKSRRNRMDPEKSSATTLVLLRQTLENEKEDDSDKEDVEINQDFADIEHEGHNDAKSVAYEDLRERLRLKIEELRAGRGGSESKMGGKKLDKKRVQEKKRKRESEHGSSSVGVPTAASQAANELKFSHVKMEGDENSFRGKKKRKLSKLKELERAKELAESKTEKASWKNAMSRAAGVKVHDNPKLLERSLKKEKKRQQKNAKKWKERIEAQQKSKSDKQEVRSQNIQDRIKQKKMRRIAAREKKLMRPGFEGRKKGYINETSTAASL